MKIKETLNYIKKKINKFLQIFGIKIIRNKNFYFDIDYLTKVIVFNDEPIIFDIGGNEGQSIKIFKNLYPNSKIHTFEPIRENIEIIKKKYHNNNQIILNNCAIGDVCQKKFFNINSISGHSSFNSLIPNTTWLKSRSRAVGVEEKNYTKLRTEVDVITLDSYAKENNIKVIDILKIDTQGYEAKVLEGASELLKLQKIKLIKLEIIFSEIYENSLNIYDCEKYLIPNGYKLFAISNNGNLFLNTIFQSDFIYISADVYSNFKYKTNK